jgi:putative SOS response-associated peptidase YedK
MCGRYLLTVDGEVLVDAFSITTPVDWQPRFNIAPTQSVPIVRAPEPDGRRELAKVHWGLIPRWAKEPDIGNRMINARSETAADKPSFRTPFRQRRCLIPADGFYEWLKTGSGKQPYAIRFEDGRVFAFAGLWERWRDRETGEHLDSCTILTTAPNDLVAPIHDRMPVILPADAWDRWLDVTVTEPDLLQPLLGPHRSDGMVATPVSRRVNSPRNDDPSCLQPD